MTEEQKTQVRLLRKQGFTYAEIAWEVGSSKSSVYRVLNPEGQARTNKKRRLAKEAWARANYHGRCLYCGESTAERHRKRCAGCERRSRTQVHALVLDVVQAMYEQGWLIREMSAAFGHETINGVAPWLRELRRAGRVGYRHRFTRQVAPLPGVSLFYRIINKERT